MGVPGETPRCLMGLPVPTAPQGMSGPPGLPSASISLGQLSPQPLLSNLRRPQLRPPPAQAVSGAEPGLFPLLQQLRPQAAFTTITTAQVWFASPGSGEGCTAR